METELIIEITGAGFALFYLWLEIEQRNAMWVVGIISAVFYIFIFYHEKFYADMGLNAYYLLASVYGLWYWRKERMVKTDAQPAKGEAQTRITCAHATRKQSLVLAGIACGLFAALYLLLKTCTDSPVPVGDAFTTARSIVAMWMRAHKLIEQWGVWFVVNVASASLYFWRELYPTAALFLVYSVASVIGYLKWKEWMKSKDVTARR
jgi:nicotinamide mononucleotide transporter